MGAWGRGQMYYSCEIGNTVYSNMWETGSTLRIPIPSVSYDAIYIAPSPHRDKDTSLYLYTGDHLEVSIIDGNNNILALENWATWVARPGGYGFEYPIYSWYTKVSLLGNDPIPVSDTDKLLCNPNLYWDGEPLASFYIYV